MTAGADDLRAMQTIVASWPAGLVEDLLAELEDMQRLRAYGHVSVRLGMADGQIRDYVIKRARSRLDKQRRMQDGVARGQGR